MSRRILAILLGFCTLFSLILVIYRICEPNIAQAELVAPTTLKDGALDYTTLKEYTLSTGNSQHYYYFCDSRNADCAYFELNVLNPLKQQSERLEVLEYVDCSSVMDIAGTTQFKSDWNFSSFPALVSVKVADGEIIVENVLEWNHQDPFDQYDIKMWLIEQDIWDGLNDVVDQPVTTN